MLASEAIVLSLPVLIKARQDGNRRLVELQASVEVVDSEGDVILQSALLGSADRFVKSGTIDIDHLSEIGHRIPNLPLPPAYYIIGRPTGVLDLGKGGTGVTCELFQHDGKNPATAKADEIWNSLQTDPPMPWRASIYGFPTNNGLVDCSKSATTNQYGATRYLVSELDWKSLAFTRNPINDAISRTAHVLSAKAVLKSAIAQFACKASPEPTPVTDVLTNFMFSPRSREELLGAHYREHISKGRCPCAGGSNGNSVYSFREHFANCCMEDAFTADMHALALMYLLKREPAL